MLLDARLAPKHISMNKTNTLTLCLSFQSLKETKDSEQVWWIWSYAGYDSNINISAWPGQDLVTVSFWWVLNQKHWWFTEHHNYHKYNIELSLFYPAILHCEAWAFMIIHLLSFKLKNVRTLVDWFWKQIFLKSVTGIMNHPAFLQ